MIDICTSPLGSATVEVEDAVEMLHRAVSVYFLVDALLTRSWLRAANNQADLARADLDEAWQIAERGPMRLQLADIRLYRARLFFRRKKYPWGSAEEDLLAARRIIHDCGYGCRKEEMEQAEERIKKGGRIS